MSQVMPESYYEQGERLSRLIDRYRREGRRHLELKAQQAFNRHIDLHGKPDEWKRKQGESA